MTPQEIFDFVAEKLKIQKDRSIGYPHGSLKCVYLSPDGNMCAVGHILPTLGLDPELLQKLQSFSGGVCTLISLHQDDLPSWFVESEELLSDLQDIHDTVINWENGKRDMAYRLRKAAQRHNLNFNSETWLKDVPIHY